MKKKVASGILLFSTLNLYYKYSNNVVGTDEFAEHTRNQHLKHLLSGMHQPYVASADKIQIFKSHFKEFEHLVPNSFDEIQTKRTIKTDVIIKPLNKCPMDKIDNAV